MLPSVALNNKQNFHDARENALHPALLFIPVKPYYDFYAMINVEKPQRRNFVSMNM